MSLITCPDCGKSVLEHARSCPFCGCRRMRLKSAFESKFDD